MDWEDQVRREMRELAEEYTPNSLAKQIGIAHPILWRFIREDGDPQQRGLSTKTFQKVAEYLGYDLTRPPKE